MHIYCILCISKTLIYIFLGWRVVRHQHDNCDNHDDSDYD